MADDTDYNFQYADEAAAAIQEFLRSAEGRKLPKDIQDKAWDYLRPGGSISFAVAYFTELVYARAQHLDKHPAVLALAAACAAMCGIHGIDNMHGARGAGIMLALQRQSGHKAPPGVKFPKAEDDPAPRTDFMTVEDQAEAGAETPLSPPSAHPNSPEPIPAGEPATTTE